MRTTAIETPSRQQRFEAWAKRHGLDPEIYRESQRELARKMRARKRANIALGAALFERLTGEKPVLKTPKASKPSVDVSDWL